MSQELFKGITLHHKDGFDVHPVMRDGGVKVDGTVLANGEEIVRAILAGGATRGTNEAGQGNGNYRVGTPATPTYTLADEFQHLDGGAPKPAVTERPSSTSKPQPEPVAAKLDGNALDKTINSKGKYIAWGIAAFLLVMLLIID